MRVLRFFSTAVAFAILIASPSFAEEGRPWLCRDKPVFSSDRSMEYVATARPGRQWRMFFLQYSPDAAHGGFDIVNSRGISAHRDPGGGNLPARRDFAGAPYPQGGPWGWPEYTHDDRQPKLADGSN